MRLDVLQTESRRLGDISYALKLDVQNSDREYQLASKECGALADKRS
jgi:hypothetical protein